MKKELNKKGFTLAELLIVVAIIAILIAIAIPVFTKQLEKSRDATTAANIRAAYAEAIVDIIDRNPAPPTVTGSGLADYTKAYNCKVQSADKFLPTFANSLPVSAGDAQEICEPGATKITFQVNSAGIIMKWHFDVNSGNVYPKNAS